jgi:DNA-binding CsgD family transcriptional regulator
MKMTHHHPDPSHDPSQNTLPVEVPEQTLTPEEVRKLVEATELETDTGWLDYLEQRPESKLSKEATDLLAALRGDRDLPEERDVPTDLPASHAAASHAQPMPKLYEENLPTKVRDLSRWFDDAKLTDRQRECISLRLEYRLPVAKIARRLGVSRPVVDEHLEAASRKIDQRRMNEKHSNKVRSRVL